MTMRNTTEQWGSLARFFHWAVALLIFAAIGIGLVMGELPKEDRMFAFTSHKSIGMLALALILCRIVWRLTDKAPAPLATMPRVQVLAAELVHWALYALMLAVPVVGYMSSSFGHYPFPFFMQENLQVPLLLEKNDELREIFGELHEGLAWALIGVLAAHIGAALYHHIIAKDAILERMTPFISKK